MSKSNSNSDDYGNIENIEDLSEQFEDIDDDNDDEGIIDNYSGDEYNYENEYSETDNINFAIESSPEIFNKFNKENTKKNSNKKNFNINDIKKQFENMNPDEIEFLEDNVNYIKNNYLRNEIKNNDKSSSNKVDLNNLTKEDIMYLSKLNLRAERYEDAVKYATDYIKLKPVLSYDERNTLSNCFKSLLLLKRTSLNYLSQLFISESKSLYKKSTKLNSDKKVIIENNIKSIEEVKLKVEGEYYALIDLVLDIVENTLLPNSKKEEAQVFYMKLKADYYRYKGEFKENGSEYLEKSEKSYHEAYLLAEDSLPITSITRVGLALNFSIFFYEHKEMIDEAIIIARNCYEEAIKSIDDVDPRKVKDYVTIVQIIKENIVFWNSEKNDEELENTSI